MWVFFFIVGGIAAFLAGNLGAMDTTDPWGQIEWFKLNNSEIESGKPLQVLELVRIEPLSCGEIDEVALSTMQLDVHASRFHIAIQRDMITAVY